MRTTGRWVRRGSTVVVLDVERGGAELEGPFALEVPAFETTSPPTLRRGMTGSAVRDLQTRLAANGLDVGAVDGAFGARTEAAVLAFQRARGLAADGIVGAQTWAALQGAARAPWGTPPPSSTPPAGPPSGGSPPPSGGVDPAIEKLNLLEPARSGAYAIKRKHPWVVFTSGRRDAAGQAWAMAGNVVRSRPWIGQTYARNPVSIAAQAWVDAHPEARTQQAIADGLLSVFRQFSPRDLGRLSFHMSGLAFDIRPVPAQESAIRQTVNSIPGVKEFLTKEGDLIIWHVGFQ
jgi:peptidoglycan hydrolase-like protein with peptidoglycan-binding domain